MNEKKESCGNITIKELYELAVRNGAENSPIFLNYSCNDSWYDYSGNIKHNNIFIDENAIVIEIENVS